MLKVIELRNWTLCSRGDRYTPPEGRTLCAGGSVESHPDLSICKDAPAEERRITTSGIESATGRLVKTRNSVYNLVGPPCEHFHKDVLGRHHLMFEGDIGPIVKYLNGGGLE